MNSSRSKATQSHPILATAHSVPNAERSPLSSGVVISLPLEGCLKMTPSEGYQEQPQCLEWVQGLVSIRAQFPIQTATPVAQLCSGKPQRPCLLSMGLKSLSVPFFADSCGEGFLLASIFPEHSRSSQGLWGRVWPGLGFQSTIWVKANITDSFHGQHRVPYGRFRVSLDTGQSSQPVLSPVLKTPPPTGQLPAVPSPVRGARSHWGYSYGNPEFSRIDHGLRGDLNL